MTQEEKDLLLKDLCARLPYGVKVYIEPSLETGEDGITITLDAVDLDYNVFGSYSVNPEDVKPYLRPMSSMTEEEKDRYRLICSMSGNDMNEKDIVCALEFLNAHHFDYRGLIERGLALKAPEGMYNQQIIMNYEKKYKEDENI